MALTEKQKMFVKEYLVDLNASAALLRAGYKSKNPDVDGHQLLVKPSIKEAIQQAQQERSNKLDLTAEWVLQRFKDISDRCMQAEAVLDREGNPTGEYRFDSSGANKATEMIGKHLGMFKDNLNIIGSVPVKIVDDLE